MSNKVSESFGKIESSGQRMTKSFSTKWSQMINKQIQIHLKQSTFQSNES